MKQKINWDRIRDLASGAVVVGKSDPDGNFLPILGNARFATQLRLHGEVEVWDGTTNKRQQVYELGGKYLILTEDRKASYAVAARALVTRANGAPSK